MAVTIRRPEPKDGRRLFELYKEAFGIPDKSWDDYVKRTGYSYSRSIVVCENDEIAAHGRSYDFQMFLRGVPIRVGGIADLATFSEFRRKGYAKLIVQKLLQNDFEEKRGAAILYPFLTKFYQELGWETVGTDLTIYFDPGIINASRPPENIKLAPFKESDIPEVMEFYENVAKKKYSLLVRSQEYWSTVLKRQQRKIVIREDNKVVGYFFVNRKSYTSWEFPHWKGRIIINEWLAETPGAVQALFWYLQVWKNTITELSLRVPSLEAIPFRLFLNDNDFKIASNNGLMGRVVSIEHLFSSLKWPKDLTAKLTFNIKDSLLPQNNGTWELTVEDGKFISIEPKKNFVSGDYLKMDVRHLSGIVFGGYTTQTLYKYGLVKIKSSNVGKVLSLWEQAFPPWQGFMFDIF